MDTPFNYPYRWSQILNLPLDEQIALLEERDRALELYFVKDGRCPFELPYRWDQVLPALLAGEEWAIACLEENDRTIEGLFANCQCGPSEWTVTFRGVDFSGFAYGEYDLLEDATLVSVATHGTFDETEKAYVAAYTYGNSAPFDNFTGLFSEVFLYNTSGGHPNRTEAQMIYGEFSLTDDQWGPFPNTGPWEDSLAWNGNLWTTELGWTSSNFLGYNLPLSMAAGDTLAAEISPDFVGTPWTADLVFTFSGTGTDTVIAL